MTRTSTTTALHMARFFWWVMVASALLFAALAFTVAAHAFEITLPVHSAPIPADAIAPPGIFDPGASLTAGENETVYVNGKLASRRRIEAIHPGYAVPDGQGGYLLVPLAPARHAPRPAPGSGTRAAAADPRAGGPALRPERPGIRQAGGHAPLLRKPGRLPGIVLPGTVSGGTADLRMQPARRGGEGIPHRTGPDHAAPARASSCSRAARAASSPRTRAPRT